MDLPPLTQFEEPLKNEQELIDNLTEILKHILEKDSPKGESIRVSHNKMTALIKGEFTVDPDLAEELQVGLFQPGKSYPAWIRFANSSERAQPDSKPDMRGCALKLMGVTGEKLFNDHEAHTQDFHFASHPVSPLATAREFYNMLYYIHTFHLLIFVVYLIVTGRGSALKTIKQSSILPTSPLDIRYWSIAAYLFGNRAL